MSFLRALRELNKQAAELLLTILASLLVLIGTIVSILLTLAELLFPVAILIILVMLLMHSRGFVELRY